MTHNNDDAVHNNNNNNNNNNKKSTVRDAGRDGEARQGSALDDVGERVGHGG